MAEGDAVRSWQDARVSEALLGQLYLVSVVALVIGNVGHERPPM